MSGGRKEESSAAGEYPLIAVAVDKDKGSQHALKWAIDNLVSKGQTIILVHVNTKTSGEQAEAILKEVMMPFRCFCKRKNIQSKDVLLEDTDVAQAIIDFISQAAIEKLVVGAPSRTGFTRFKISDTPTNISRGAPDFCTVFVISRAKVSSVKNAIRSAPKTSSLRAQIQSQAGTKPEAIAQPRLNSFIKGESGSEVPNLHNGRDPIRSPFTRGMHSNTKSYGEIPTSSESDASFDCSGRASIDRAFQPRFCTAPNDIDRNFEMQARTSYMDSYAENEFSSPSLNSFPSHTIDEVEAEMRRLRLELKQTMEMYSSACREALTAKQKTTELNQWKMEEEQRIHHARQGEEAALAVAEKERAKCKIATEAAEASKQLAELESQKRINTEMNALNESKGGNKELGSLACGDSRYRRYTIEELEAATENFAEKRKIGEGGYGPVYKCSLDHTPVAVKVLRPDAAQGRSQFQQEVEILSCIRHPSMVLLLGACPEYGCLVYEYMANGSLEDRLFRRGNTPPIPWQHRFRIAAEIGTGLLFLHQTKPEPLVHRDLKPANILLDRNYVSKISDVGLARLVPPSVADNVTQYRMTSAAGTFCYIDPEYQQTGMLGTKSDIYSLGILLLQLVTGKPPMGLTHHVERAIEKGKFEEMLDPTVPDWPVEAALCLAQMALKCAELRRKDRPDLGSVVLPELKRLRALGEVDMQHFTVGSIHHSSVHGHVSMLDVKSGPQPLQSGYESSTSQSNANAGAERQKSVF